MLRHRISRSATAPHIRVRVAEESLARGMPALSPGWDPRCVRRIRESPVIHWMNKEGAECGAPAGSFVSPYPHTVTCRECLVALKIDLLERRLELYRQSTAFARVRTVRVAK